MLSVKLVRSLVLGDTITNPFHHDGVHVHGDDDDGHGHDDVEDDGLTHHHHHHHVHALRKDTKEEGKINKKKMPLLLFIPTRELISDTFRLASIARDIGMDFCPNSSFSHLLFSWPSPSSLSPLSSAPFSPSSSNNRPSVSSTSSSSSLFCGTLPNDAVPLPFPSLSTASSLSLLRYFVSLSKGLFKLVFFEIEPHDDRFNTWDYWNSDFNCSSPISLFSRVSGRRVKSMDDISRALTGHGWALYRTRDKPGHVSPADSVYLFQKKDSNRVRAKWVSNGGGGSGDCRIRELRLPVLDFKNGVSLRILQYILLMTDDIFYLA